MTSAQRQPGKGVQLRITQTDPFNLCSSILYDTFAIRWPSPYSFTCFQGTRPRVSPKKGDLFQPQELVTLKLNTESVEKGNITLSIPTVLLKSFFEFLINLNPTISSLNILQQ